MIHTNVVITEYRNRICAMTFCDNQLEDLHVEAKESLLGNIYIAKVKNINKNINAAFLELFDGQMSCPFESRFLFLLPFYPYR